jgi:hypothetical protein
MTVQWKCAGCGALYPDRVGWCDCPTNIVYRKEGDGLVQETKRMDPKRCPHEEFNTLARIGRLSDVEGGPITGYTANIKIECALCGLPFRFRGLAAGSHFAEPRVSADGTELRAPLEPALIVEICGMPLISGRA